VIEMSQAIDKLLSLAGPPLGPPVEPVTKTGSGLLHELVSSVLSHADGFYAFESALHVFPLTGTSGILGIDSWNAADLWRNHYGGMADGFLFFAEDVFGGQFGIKEEVVYSLDPETGETSPLARSVDEWARKILDDYEFMTGYPLAHQWQVANGVLSVGERLLPKKPFVLGGEYSVANLVAMGAVKSMRFRGDLAVQIRDLPDGASITFKIVD
jgi:hypothetical protein